MGLLIWVGSFSYQGMEHPWKWQLHQWTANCPETIPTVSPVFCDSVVSPVVCGSVVSPVFCGSVVSPVVCGSVISPVFCGDVRVPSSVL